MLRRGSKAYLKGMKNMYNPKSMKAEEFISHEEILRTLEYAEANKNNLELIEEMKKIYGKLLLPEHHDKLKINMP